MKQDVAKNFNEWVERHMKTTRRTKSLFDSKEAKEYGQAKEVAQHLVLRGKAPVFAKGKKNDDRAGDIKEFNSNDNSVEGIKNHEFVWAVWENFSEAELEDECVPHKYAESVAKTLALVKNVVDTNEVLSLHVPKEFMPTKDAVTENAFRDVFFRVVDEFSKKQRRHVMLQSLKMRTVDKTMEEELKDHKDEVAMIKKLENPYLFAAPIDSDLIFTAEMFMEKSGLDRRTE